MTKGAENPKPCIDTQRKKMDCLLKNIYVLGRTLSKSVEAALYPCFVFLLLCDGSGAHSLGVSNIRQWLASLLTMVLQTVGTGLKASPVSSVHSTLNWDHGDPLSMLAYFFFHSDRFSFSFHGNKLCRDQKDMHAVLSCSERAHVCSKEKELRAPHCLEMLKCCIHHDLWNKIQAQTQGPDVISLQVQGLGIKPTAHKA